MCTPVSRLSTLLLLSLALSLAPGALSDANPQASASASGVEGASLSSGGNGHGSQSAASSFEILGVKAYTNGFEITFSEAIKPGQHIVAGDFAIRQWHLQPALDDNRPKTGEAVLKVVDFSLSADRTRASFMIQGIKANHLVYFQVVRPFISVNDQSLRSTETWHALNAIPVGQPLIINADYSPAHNQLSKAEQAAGWRLLFDGKSLAGLRNYNRDGLGERWVVDAGTLHMTGLKPGEEGWHTPEGGGDVVITPEPVESFELYLEWKLAPNGNSGIIYNVKEDPSLEHAFLSGTEYQLLDNVGHPDGKIKTHRAGDLYDLIATRIVTVNPPGQWNRTRLVVDNGRIAHWLNGYKVVETQMHDAEWQALIADSKFRDWEHFAQPGGGHIVLQDHADKVWFRNIKLRPLSH